MGYLFTTPRLVFRRYQPGDKVRLSELNADPAVMEFFPSTVGEAGTQAIVQRIEQHFETYRYTFFSVERRDKGQFIGLIGLMHPSFEAHFTPCVEIGWRLHKDAWGQGFATEGAKACLGYAWRELELQRVYSFTALPNRPSERVMQKIGMRKVGTFEHPQLEEGHWLRTHVLYCIEKPFDWRP